MGFLPFLSNNSFEAWRIRSWLANYLCQSSAENYTSRLKEHQKNDNEELSSYFLEDSQAELVCRICIYSIEALSILAMLLITTLAIKPVLPLMPSSGTNSLEFELQANKNVLNIAIVLAIRCAVSLNYALNLKTRSSYHYCLNKLIQIISLFLFRIHFSNYYSLFFCFTLLAQLITDIIYIICKQQRRGFFDSRLNYFYYFIRATISLCVTIFFNFAYSYPTHSTPFLCFLLLCASCHCFCLIKDSFYCLLTRNMLLIIWTVLLVKTASFLAIQQLLKIDFKKELSSNWILTHIIMYALSAFIIFLVFRNKQNIQIFSFNGFSSLKHNFKELGSKQGQLHYIWQAIRLISIDPKNLWLIQETVNKISWVTQYNQQSEESLINRSGQALIHSQNEKERKYRLNKQFHRRFSHYCYQLLIENFKQVNEMKYILIFFFNHKSAQKMLLFLNRINFYDIRQSLRIEKEHRNSDLAAKVNEMIRNQQQVVGLVKNYVKQLKIFVEAVSDEGLGIDLLVCEKIGNKLIEIQKQIKKFGTQDNQQSQQRGLKKESLLLSAYGRFLLNIVRKELLGQKQLNFPPAQIDERQKTISQIMNQQQSLIVLSAELESIGQIIALNCAASKLTGYSCSQLVGQNINLLLPEDIKMAHTNQLKQKAVIYKNSQKGYIMKSIVYVVKKNKYCALCELSVKFIDGTMGKRWITKLTQIQQFNPFIICDQGHNVIGLNEAAHRFGFGMDWVGVSLGSWFAQQLLIANNSEKYSNQLCLQLYEKIIRKNAILGVQQIISHSNYLDVKQRRRHKMFGSIIQSVEQNSEATQIKKRVIKFQDQLIKTHNEENSIEKRQGEEQRITENNKEKIRTNSLVLECNVLSQVHRIGQSDIIGYYVFKMSEIVEGEKNENESMNLDANCLTVNCKDKNKDSSRRRNKKYRNSITFINENHGLNWHESSFKFDYDIIQDRYFNVVENQNNNKIQSSRNEEKLSRLKQLQESIQEDRCQIAQIRNAEEINELIYINGELEFRQNKKLEQIYQCDTYPLHSNHNFFFEEFGDINKEDLTNNPIRQKNEIFELLDHVQQSSLAQAKQKRQMKQKLGRETSILSKYSKQRIIILISLFIFFAFGCALIATGFVFLRNQGNQAANKIQTLLLMGQRVNLLNKLAFNFERYILLNLRLNLMPSDIQSIKNYSTVSDIIGDMNKWDQILKQIEQKNNLINQIDLIQNQWMHSNFNSQIHNLTTQTDFSSQFNRMSTNLLNLDQLVKGAPEIDKRINSNNKVFQVIIDLNVLKGCLLVIRNLVEETIPMNLYTITKTMRIYSQSTIDASKTIKILSILFALCSLLFGLISYCQISQIIKQRSSNMQIFSFFPNEFLQIFYKKLQNFQLQISNEEDITSELGIDELEVENINADEQLIFHKKKIKKNNNKIVEFIPLFGFFVFLALGLGVMGSLIEVNNLFSCSQKFENWFALTNGRIIEANYLWNQQVINEGIYRLPSTNEYFKTNPIHFISMDALYENRDYIIMYKKNLENLKSRKFTNNFQQQISELLDKKYCEQVLSSVTGIVCEGKISNLSIETIQTYTQLKQLILNKLFKNSLRQKSYDKFIDIVKLFSIKNMALNEDRLMASNKQIITREMSRLKVKNQLSVWKNIIILAAFMTIFLVISVWLLYHSQQFTLKPIVVMARCFPLLLLNANQYFQCWFYCRKNKEIR